MLVMDKMFDGRHAMVLELYFGQQVHGSAQEQDSAQGHVSLPAPEIIITIFTLGQQDKLHTTSLLPSLDLTNVGSEEDSLRLLQH